MPTQTITVGAIMVKQTEILQPDRKNLKNGILGTIPLNFCHKAAGRSPSYLVLFTPRPIHFGSNSRCVDERLSISMKMNSERN
jgi:hypothetical protein